MYRAYAENELYGKWRMGPGEYGKCTLCDKGMTELEAKASQWGNKFPDELVCDGCFKLVFASGRGNLTDTELASGTLAPINELIANAQ